MSTTPRTNMPNATDILHLHAQLDKLLVDAMRNGVSGEFVLRIPVSDGRIQRQGVTCDKIDPRERLRLFG